MRWVEVMGPHGSGKTTLCRALRNYPGITRFPVKSKAIAPLVEPYNFNYPTTWKAPDAWQGFLKVVEELYRRSMDDKAPDLKRRRNMCRSVVRMSIVHAADHDGVTVRDLFGAEGMRLSFLLWDPDAIEEYFDAMPVSHGVVLLEAPADVIVSRNKARRTAPDFSSLTKQGIAACATGAEVLEKRTRVLRLDATRPVEVNVKAIAEFATGASDVPSASQRNLPTG